MRLAPEDVGLRWQWARALAALDAKKYRGDIEAELEAALAIDPATDLDRVMQERAEVLLAELVSRRSRDVEDIAGRMH